MKNLKWVALILMSAGVTGCVSPFYGTARIEEGWHVNAGGAAIIYYDGWVQAKPYYKGIRADIELSYGICKYLQGCARAGLGWGFDGKNYRNEPVPKHDFLLDVAIGPQFARPVPFKDGGQLTPALRIEVGYANEEFYATPTVLIGFGNPESFTIGTRFLMYMPSQVFFTIHKNRFAIFVGIDIWTQLSPDYWLNPPVVTLGIGYKIK